MPVQTALIIRHLVIFYWLNLTNNCKSLLIALKTLLSLFRILNNFILILTNKVKEKRCNENIHTRHFAFGINQRILSRC